MTFTGRRTGSCWPDTHPAGVLVNDDLEVVHFRGHTGRYLEPAEGAATFSLLKMARADLLPDLRQAIEEARKHGAPCRREGVKALHDGRSLVVNIEVTPVQTPATGRHFLVLFEEAPAEAPAKKAAGRPKPVRRRDRIT
jgi:two-component system CheB/CheR fusion protein